MFTLDDFKPGDVVSLRAGGHPMTVRSVSPAYKHIHCVWFDRDHHLHEGDFAPETLKKL